MSAIHDAYKRFKHLDELLSDSEWIGYSALNRIARDLWIAVKADATAPQPAINDAEIALLRQELALTRRLLHDAPPVDYGKYGDWYDAVCDYLETV